MSTKSSKGSRVISGFLALSIANLFVKIVGLLLKIPLRSILDDSGMAYYNNAYDIYAFLFTVSNVGMPTAVSMLVSENRAKGNVRESKRVLKIAVWLFLIIGLIGTSIMFFGAPLFERAYKIDNSAYCIMAIAPTLLFICMASAFKGYFQGYQHMIPSAISNVIEALGKMALGLLFASFAIKRGEPIHIVAAYATLGLTIGVAAGTLFLIIRKLLFKPESFDTEYAEIQDATLQTRSITKIVKLIFAIAIPITLSSSVMTFSNMLDGIILSRQLQNIGYNQEAVKDMIGNFKTCVTPISNIILGIANPITSVVVPLISAAIASNNIKKAKDSMNTTLRLAVIVLLPCIFGISVLAEPIVALLFGSDAAFQAAPLLTVHVLSVFFMSMISVTAAFLQAHKLGKYPVYSVIVGAVVKIVTTATLASVPSINIMGSPIASVFSCFVISVINFYFIRKHIGYTPNFGKLFVRPIFAALICALSAVGAYSLIMLLTDGIVPNETLMLSIFFAAIVYIVTVFMVKAINREEVRLLPKGKKLEALLTKIKLLK